MSEEVFWQLPPHHRPTKLEGEPTPKFSSTGGQPLPVGDRYEFRIRISTKFLKHKLHVIPDLNEPLILGINFIQKHQLWYCPKKKPFTFEGQPNGGQGRLKVYSATTVLPLSVTFIKATVRTKGGALPEGNLCIANVPSKVHPLVTGGLVWSPDIQGQITIAVKNCSPVDLELHRNDFIGSVENVQDCETQEIDPAYLQAVAQQCEANKPHQISVLRKKQFIMDTVKMQVPEKYNKQYCKFCCTIIRQSATRSLTLAKLAPSCIKLVLSHKSQLT
jgi:hypothetical protein